MPLNTEDPDDQALFEWMIRMEREIRIELGLMDIGTDEEMDDELETVMLEFDKAENRRHFLELVEIERFDYEETWGQMERNEETDSGWWIVPLSPSDENRGVCIPRRDLVPVLDRLIEINSATFPDYAKRKQAARDAWFGPIEETEARDERPG